MTIIGLDPSTHTGWARTSIASPCIEYGVVHGGTIKKTEDCTRAQVKRMQRIRDGLLCHISGADLVMIEAPVSRAIGSQVIQQAALGYLLRACLVTAGIDYVDVSPSSLKKFITGKGNAEKNLVNREIFKRWGVSIDDDNAADAYVLVQIGRALVGEIECSTAEQRAVIEGLRKSNPLTA